MFCHLNDLPTVLADNKVSLAESMALTKALGAAKKAADQVGSTLFGVEFDPATLKGNICVFGTIKGEALAKDGYPPGYNNGTGACLCEKFRVVCN